MINGRIPSSSLRPIPGSNSGLLRVAALSYTAMHYASVRQFGVSLAIIDGPVGRTYRNFQRQVLARAQWCAVGKCGNAAIPGTSNHGLATTVDLMSQAQRSAVDRIGAFYGWAKRCSDAAWEWWHVKYNPACTGARWRPKPPVPDPLRFLGKRQLAAADRLLYHRREARRERRTGRGRRYGRQVRWRKFWQKRVEKLYRRASGDRKHALGLVLADRTGHIHGHG